MENSVRPFLDTNVLLYTISAFSEKHRECLDITDENFWITNMVESEFEYHMELREKLNFRLLCFLHSDNDCLIKMKKDELKKYLQNNEFSGRGFNYICELVFYIQQRLAQTPSERRHKVIQDIILAIGFKAKKLRNKIVQTKSNS